MCNGSKAPSIRKIDNTLHRNSNADIHSKHREGAGQVLSNPTTPGQRTDDDESHIHDNYHYT